MKNSSNQRINVVLFWFMNDWGMYGRTYEKIAENLANQDDIQRVLCILPPIKFRQRHAFLPFIFKKVNKKLFVLTPNNRVIPSRFQSGQIGRNINESFISSLLLLFLKCYSFNENDTVLWVFPPHAYINILKKLIPHRLLITQIMDNNIFKDDIAAEKINFIKTQYEDLAKESDIVITFAKFNFDYFRPLNSNCYFFENAVDPVFFGDPSNFPYRANKNRPRLGYAGFISVRTDIDLLGYLARVRPEFDLVLAGPNEIPSAEFEKILLPNVQYVGKIPYEKMPEFLKSLDICLIPHRDTQFSRSMSVLKMMQYLASGRPIVSTKVAGVLRWENLISIADNHDEFILYIDETIKNDNIEKSRERIDAARLETWDKRVKEMLNIISKVINSKY